MANEIQELKFQVGEAWKGVYSSSTVYGLANVVQDPTGLSIYRSQKSGNVGHPVSDRTWWFCIIDLSSIKEESDRIAALNEAIAQDEALRVAAEELRQQHEAERVAAETQRNEAEQARISAEQARVNAESARATAEQQRITAEEGRVSAESARVTAEQARVLAETLRANAEEQRAANEQNRIAAEQQRIERAESDHQRVESDLADIAVYTDSLGAFDLSKHNAVDGVLATYADLSAALTALNSLDSKYKYGGMSFKFVLSSDNKYVQYRLMSQTFSTDTNDWSVSIETVETENPEFVEVKTDSEGRILYGVNKTTGNFFFGAGCPQQVKDYIQSKIDELSLDEYEDIVAFINGLEKGDKTLQELLNDINTEVEKKVNKETGKSLIDSNFASDVPEIISTDDNSEYLSVEIDADGKILGGRKSSGTKFENMTQETPGSTTEFVNNPEWLELKVDAEKKIIEGTKKNGEKYIGIIDNEKLKEIEGLVQLHANEISDLDLRVSNLEESREPVITDLFKFDTTLLDVSSEMDSINMKAVDSLGCATFQEQIYSKIDSLVSLYPDVLEKIDLATFVDESYPVYATLNGEASGDYLATPTYHTYMYKYHRTDGAASTGVTANKRKVYILAGVHGWEAASQLNTYIFLSKLCKCASIDYYTLASMCDFYIIPCLNGYGAYHAPVLSGGSSNASRKNANGIDINRNCPTNNWTPTGNPSDYNYGGSTPNSEFETKLITKSVGIIKPDIFIDHHSYAPVVNYDFYVEPATNNDKRILYNVLFDWTYRACFDYSQYYGSTFKTHPASDFIVTPDANGMTFSWAHQFGIENSMTVEVCLGIPYNGGVFTPDYSGTTEYAEPIIKLNELMLRLIVMRGISYQLINNLKTNI